MRKKILLASSLLVATMANADISQKGLFIGIDFSENNYELQYENKGAIPVVSSLFEDTEHMTSFKVGYQYYFTRVYGRYSEFSYTDTNSHGYTIEGSVLELNADYIPVFYTNQSKTWDIRGVFGIGVGYNQSTFKDYDINLLPAGETADDKQHYYMEYGYQVGLMSETSSGLSIEAVYRARYGDLQEYNDDTAADAGNKSTFSLVTKEFYLGINYLF